METYFALFIFLEKKAAHSKLDGLFYSDLTMQEYLKLNTMTAYEAKLVFSYRVEQLTAVITIVGLQGSVLDHCATCTLTASPWHSSALQLHKT